MRNLKYLILFLLNILCLNQYITIGYIIGNIENGNTYF